MVTKIIRGHRWVFLGNYPSKKEAQYSAKQHKKEWGGRTTITFNTIGIPPHKRYLLWYRR